MKTFAVGEITKLGCRFAVMEETDYGKHIWRVYESRQEAAQYRESLPLEIRQRLSVLQCT